jgi:carboxyl-terminal processing protease
MVRRIGRRVRLLAALLALAWPGWGVAQAPLDPWPMPAERPLAGEPAWQHREGRERLLRELVALFQANYWDPGHLDWAAWGESHRAAVVAADDRRALDAALTRMVRELRDDHSSWLGLPGATEAPEREPAATPRLGVQLSYVDGRGLVVERVYAGTPAAAADLRRADVITAVGDLDLRTAGSLFEANAALAAALSEGPAALRVERGRVAFDVEVVASPVPWVEVATRPYGVMLDAEVGYLHVPTFNEAGVGLAVHRALHDLDAAGARALVLDLRGNLGGRLVEAGLVVGAFLEGRWARATARGELAWVATTAFEGARARGVVSQLVEPGGAVIGEARVERPAWFEGPLVVVVGSETASAGEIVAGALLGAGRARVVGETTQGNVEAVRAFVLSDGSRVLVAIAQVEGADGAALQGGVAPEVTARASVLDLARGVDPPVAEALRLLGRLPFTPGRWF